MTRSSGTVEIALGATTGRSFPGLGLAFPEPVRRPSDERLDLLLDLRLAHLRVRLELGSETWRAALGNAARTGLATATSLELVVNLGRHQRELLETLAHELRLAQVGIARFIIEPGGGPSGREIVAEASSVLASVSRGAGFGVVGPHAAAGGELLVRSSASLPLRGWRAALDREREQ